MRYSHSRLVRTEEKRNIRRAYYYIFLTIVSLILVIVFGLPAVAKLAAFLTDLRGSANPVEKNDITPPAPPQVESLPEATNKSNLEVKGTSEAEATIAIIRNSEETETISSSDGKFSYTLKLTEGENEIFAKAKDQSGNVSQDSARQTVIFDNKPPELEVLSPTNNSSFFGSKQRQVVIEGKTDTMSSVTINDRLVVVDEEGKFTFATTLSEGDNNFNIKSRDLAGNETQTTLTLKYSL